ncbi:hypothetical protein BCR34DRAFT_605619 [Clohesyomyces aquaticus]|uniref:Uncharacterized protein n=1 Tax=Clohesyomyces aquaticus TaxID=1231657 RepID=A0A1Y1YWD4_9PLEO|nr:hypothetical protein BCR34DRAFT_605619 [Clohesyomyces aquaticus]
MPLLDLPPEVFQRIISEYVTEEGVSESWKRKVVCKTFSVFIEEEVLGRQSPQAFIRGAEKSILNRHIDRYLVHRYMALYGAPDLLPALMRSSVDIFMEITGSTSNDQRLQFATEIAKALTTHCKSLNYLATKAKPKRIAEFAQDKKEANALGVAIAMQDKHLICLVLGRNPCIWSRTHTFGHPLELVLRIGNKDIVWIMLYFAETNPLSNSAKDITQALSVSIRLALETRGFEIAISLLRWHFRHIGRPFKNYGGYWLRWAIESGAMDFIKQLLEFGFPDGYEEYYQRTFIRIPWYTTGANPTELLRLLFRKKLVDVAMGGR